jgi:hypothetical protein
MNGSLTSLRSRVLALLLAVLMTTGFVVVGAPSTASAGDGRAAFPEGEIAAQYIHSLDRQPDQAGFDSYMRFVNQDCRWGIMDASFKIANSAEAHQRWRDNPQDLAGMLYASLLDRQPDPGGLQTYTDAIRTRGLEWATASMLASPEYNTRLNALCAGRQSSSATMFTWEQAQAFVDNEILPRAKDLAVVCGATHGTMVSLGALKGSGNFAVSFVGMSAWLANQFNSMFSIDGTCGAVAQYLLAARRINQITLQGDRYNPVFIQAESGHHRWLTTVFDDFTLRIGPEPTHWDPYKGSHF